MTAIPAQQAHAIEAAAYPPLGPAPDAAAARAFEQLLGPPPRAFPQEEPTDPGLASAAPGEGHALPGATLASPPVHAPSAGAQEVCDLVTRLVEQLYAPQPGAAAGDGAVLMRLSADVLPHTELLLARDAHGWRLEARTSSAESRRLLADSAGALAARFGARGLGEIRFEGLAAGNEPA